MFLESELGELQQSKINMLVDKVTDLNLYEMRYFQVRLAQNVQKATGLNPMKINLDWPSIK